MNANKEISKVQYEYALKRVEELLPITEDVLPEQDPNVVELSIVSELVAEYESKHFPMPKLSVAELIETALKENDLSQKELSEKMNLSPSRISDFIHGRSEPNLHQAGQLCKILGIPATCMLGL